MHGVAERIMYWPEAGGDIWHCDGNVFGSPALSGKNIEGHATKQTIIHIRFGEALWHEALRIYHGSAGNRRRRPDSEKRRRSIFAGFPRKTARKNKILHKGELRMLLEDPAQVGNGTPPVIGSLIL